MPQKHWAVAPERPQARRALEEAGYPPLLAVALCARGVETPEAARRLLSPGEEALHDPMLLRDMDRAAARIRAALDAGESMAVYGDYDVDGITAATLILDCLRQLGGQVLLYIPDRMEEGYGLNRDAVRELAARGVTLIITVDCGITAVEEVALAAELGVSVVITDHHACKSALPEACAVVNPHRPGCSYPFQGLAGVGVALKLAAALTSPEKREEVVRRYADLAAIGTVADVMPMTGENRIIVRRGLEELNRAPRPGLALLAREAGLGEKPLGTVAVGYILAPRLNAAGRMGRAALAAELLLEHRLPEGEVIARALCDLNRERQEIEGEIFLQCARRLEAEPQEALILLADEGWHQGVVGIVASRLAEQYSAPAFMVCLSGGMGKGSCRSWGSANLFELLSGCKDLLEGFGGHALAAGFTVREENLPALTLRLRALLAQAAQGEQQPTLELDGRVSPEELTVEGVDALELLEPCGAENPRPALMLAGATVQSAASVGRGRHLKLRLDLRGRSLDAIWFSPGQGAEQAQPGSRVDVAFYPQINDFRGVRTVQLQVIALRPAVTRAQAEQAAYDKYRRGEPLTAREARLLLPEREEFVRVWRYLKGRSLCSPVIEDTPARIARGAAGTGARREPAPRALVCLEVLEERGLIRLGRGTDRLSITLNRVEEKVDLENSHILRLLRGFAE